MLKSRVNGKTFICGELQTPSLAGLREAVRSGGFHPGKMSVREVIADVRHLHKAASNSNRFTKNAFKLEMPFEKVTGSGIDLFLKIAGTF